jgi:preprotein translocase subunit SecG
MIELVLNIVLVLTSAILVVLILLHRGKGGGLSSMFGGAVSSSLAGSSVVEKNLNRLTVFCAIVWAICIVAIGILVKVNS